MNKEVIDALGEFFARFTIATAALLVVVGVVNPAPEVGLIPVLGACTVVGILITGTLVYLHYKFE